MRNHALNMLTRIALMAGMTAFSWSESFADFTTDIQLSLVNGKLETAGGVTTYQPPMDGRVFSTAFTSLNGEYVAQSPGFASLPGLLQSGEQIRFDFVRELLYWNGTQLTTAVPSLKVYGTTTDVSISANDTLGKPGFILGGGLTDGSVHLHPDFAIPLSAPHGVYGIILTVGPAGTSTFTAADPILIAFRRNASALNPDQGIAAMAALVPVPEPSSGTLALLALGGCALFARHLRRQR